MKKIISFFLIILCIILLSSTGIAEDFIIHSGVKFGDTEEEVKQKETLTLIGGLISLKYKGNVAGYDNAYIEYYFDYNNDNKVYDVNYKLANTYDMSYLKEEVLDIFKELEEKLTTKYGRKISEKESAYKYLKGFYYKANIEELNIFRYKEDRRIEVNSWLVKYNNYNVKIDLYCCYDKPDIVFNKDRATAECGIEYYIYTDEELQGIINEQLEDL